MLTQGRRKHSFLFLTRLFLLFFLNYSLFSFAFFSFSFVYFFCFLGTLQETLALAAYRPTAAVDGLISGSDGGCNDG